MASDQIRRIEVRIAIAINSEEEAAVSLSQGDDESALNDALIEISNGVPLACYVVVLDLPLPDAREIRARVEQVDGGVDVEVDEA